MRADLLIRGGTLVTEHELLRADLAVCDGRVAAIVDPDGFDVRAADVLDARDRYVLPGVVDGHVHFNEPGRTHWEGYASGSAAAAAGGVTTFCDMPLNNDPPTLDAAALAIKRRAVAEQAVVDYAHWGGMVDANAGNLAELHAEGVVGCKAFMCQSGLDEYPAVDDAALFSGLIRAAELGMIIGLHAENDRLTSALAARARAAGLHGPGDWAKARPPFTEEEAVRRALLLAREAGAVVHFVHLSTPAAVRAVAEAGRQGVDATAETCPHYLTLDESDLDRLGPVAKSAPPLRAREEVEGLWRCVLDGRVDVVASDHSPCPPEEKRRGDADIWEAWGGISGVQTLLPVLLTEGIDRRGLGWSAIVRLTSGNPARRFGLYPRKGALRVGSDADVTLVEPNQEWTLCAEDLLTRWPISPFIGHTFRGRVEATYVRGQAVWRNNRIVAKPGYGQLVLRGTGGVEGA